MGATVIPMATTTANSAGTIALADQLIHLLERVPLTVEDVAAVTGADERTVTSWLERRSAPAGDAALRVNELIAACERLEITMKPDALADWLRRDVPSLGNQTPVQVLGAGGYEQIAGIAEDLIAPPFT